MRRSLNLSCAATMLVAALPVLADSWAPPRPRVFASEQGSFGFMLLEPKMLAPCTGMLFELDQDGGLKTVWKNRLVNVPVRVLVAEDGKRVITVDTYGRLGYEHALVVYDDQGKVLADYKLEDLLSRLEIRCVPTSVSSRAWTAYATFRFSSDHTHLLVQLSTTKLFSEEVRRAQDLMARTADRESQKHWRNRIEEAQAGLKQPDRVIRIDLESGALRREDRNR